MTHLLRLVLSAASGAVLVAGLFAAMGKATAPRLSASDLDRVEQAVPMTGVQLASLSDGELPGVTLLKTPPSVSGIDWVYEPTHPGFETETRLDLTHLEPELVVLSRPLSTTDAVAERRWWQNLARQLGEDE